MAISDQTDEIKNKIGRGKHNSLISVKNFLNGPMRAKWKCLGCTGGARKREGVRRHPYPSIALRGRAEAQRPQKLVHPPAPAAIEG